MPSMRELFKSEVKEGGLLGTKGLYGRSKIYIETQGAIYPPRLKALALSSPNAIADLAGITVAAIFGIRISSANRPSDTIFNSNKIFAKPLIGLAGPLAQRNTGIINTEKAYYIKQTPAPYQVVNQIKNGIETNPLGTLITAAKNELRDGTIREIFRKRTNVDDKYGSKYQHLASRSKPIKIDKKFSQYYPEYGEENAGLKALIGQIFKGKADKKVFKNTQKGLIERTSSSQPSSGVSRWDTVNNKLLVGDYENPDKLKIDNDTVNIPYVAFEIYGKTGKDAHILLPGTISGLSEDVQPTWNTYKYIGSPFNTYRYSGVERSIKFNLKLYANGKESLKNLKKNLDKLRETTFPDKDVTRIEYAVNKKITNGFSPSLVYLTISGYYKKLFGFVDSLGITIDDSTPWPTTDEGFDGVKEAPYPAVVDVSISMKVIEAVDYGKGDKTLIFNMTDTTNSKAFKEPPLPDALPAPSIGDIAAGLGLKVPEFNAGKLVGKLGGKFSSPLKLGKIP